MRQHSTDVSVSPLFFELPCPESLCQSSARPCGISRKASLPGGTQVVENAATARHQMCPPIIRSAPRESTTRERSHPQTRHETLLGVKRTLTVAEAQPEVRRLRLERGREWSIRDDGRSRPDRWSCGARSTLAAMSAWLEIASNDEWIRGRQGIAQPRTPTRKRSCASKQLAPGRSLTPGTTAPHGNAPVRWFQSLRSVSTLSTTR